MAVNFYTPKDIFRPRNPPVVRRIPLITDMHPSTSSSATHPPLRTRPTRTVTSRTAAPTIRSCGPLTLVALVGLWEEHAAAAEIGACGGGVGEGLSFDVGIVYGVLAENRL